MPLLVPGLGSALISFGLGGGGSLAGPAFQNSAFQYGAFQEAVLACLPAFQSNGFQRDAFQECETAGICRPAFQGSAFQFSGFQECAPSNPITILSNPRGAGGRAAKRHRKIIVRIDGEEFRVTSTSEVEELLSVAREIAEQQAQIIMHDALTKAAKAKRPAAKKRALDIRVPDLDVVAPDYADEFVQQVVAQVEATQKAIADTYAQAMQDAEAAQAAQRDEEDDILLLLS